MRCQFRGGGSRVHVYSGQAHRLTSSPPPAEQTSLESRSWQDQPLPAPHGPFTYTPIGQVRFTFSLAIAPSGWRVLIPFRDPWKRLVSGFRDKYLSESHGNETLFAQQWMQQDGRCSERRALVDPKVPCPYFNHAWVRGQPPKIGRSSPLNNALVRFMVQLLPFPHGGNGVADDHFRQQAVQCLAPYASAHLAPAGVDGVPIDQENALDSVSSALGHASDGLSFSQVMTGAYKPIGDPDCYLVPGELLWRLYHTVLKLDYDIISNTFANSKYQMSLYVRRQKMLENLDRTGVYRVCTARKSIERVNQSSLRNTELRTKLK